MRSRCGKCDSKQITRNDCNGHSVEQMIREAWGFSRACIPHVHYICLAPACGWTETTDPDRVSSWIFEHRRRGHFVTLLSVTPVPGSSGYWQGWVCVPCARFITWRSSPERKTLRLPPETRKVIHMQVDESLVEVPDDDPAFRGARP